MSDRPLTKVTDIAAVRRAVDAARRAGKTIGFVPTMGALHAGHLALVDRSVAECDFTVVSIFVNPTQFGPQEDLARYPRTLEADLQLCQKHGADLVFVPTEEVMYPGEQTTYVEVEALTAGLCGARRPGHFRGVTTVVTKLFNIVNPHRAYFGEKDYQQLAVIRRLVHNLNFPLTVVGVPTIREEDGLALSSRNKYLSGEERRAAPVLYRSLQKAKAALAAGEGDPARLTDIIREHLATEPLAKVDYVEIVDARTLEPLSYGRNIDLKRPVLLAAAVFLGQARLIDSVVFPAGSDSSAAAGH